MVLHTAKQSEQDGVRSLRRLVDLDRVIASETLDWDYIRVQAERSGLSTVLAVTHRLANLVLDTPVPDTLSAGDGLPSLTKGAIATMKPVQRLVRKPRQAQVSDYHLFRLWCLPGGKERLRWVKRTAAGVKDPLAWVWMEEEESEGKGTDRGWGLGLLLKVAVYQSMVLARTFASSIRRDGRRQLGFWMKSRGEV
jgi:hypothetical protein